jgi:hypothetical protein
MAKKAQRFSILRQGYRKEGRWIGEFGFGVNLLRPSFGGLWLDCRVLMWRFCVLLRKVRT